MTRPTHYANKIDLTLGETEVVLDLKLKAGGRPTEVARLILPYDVALKLAKVLAAIETETEKESEPE